VWRYGRGGLLESFGMDVGRCVALVVYKGRGREVYLEWKGAKRGVRAKEFVPIGCVESELVASLETSRCFLLVVTECAIDDGELVWAGSCGHRHCIAVQLVIPTLWVILILPPLS
jgi:hypothetical protein